jgi:DNA-binding NarL/FixJ family response regulator
VLLADDYAGILTALRRLLEPSCDVVGCVEDGMAVVEAAATLRPDVVVVDLAIPRLNGLEACRRIRDAMPETKVVILTATDDEATTQKAYSVGASAFVVKYAGAERLLSAINNAFLERTSPPAE